MYFLYLDESGSVSNLQEEYFVLAGVCVPENSVRWLTSELNKYAVTIERDNPEQVEFHAAEIFRAAELPWKAYSSKTDRIQIIKRVLGTLSHANPDITIFACAIHKASYRSEDIVLKAYEDLSSRFNLYLENNGIPDSRGMIILDNTSYEAGLQNLAASIRQSGNRWGSQNRRIIELPLFVDSKACRNIQLADHISYAVFRRYNASDLSYFNCIETRFYQKDGIVHGLAHLQTINPSCTCPACLSRRGRTS